MPDNDTGNSLLEMTTDIVSSLVSNNRVGADEVSEIIRSVHDTLASLAGASGSSSSSSRSQGRESAPSVSRARPEPAVPVSRSVTPDYIVCLEDGKQMKMLKRYLMTNYKMTPDQYRQRWNLNSDYPMVAPNYAKQRSRLAKQIGLGTSATLRRGRKKKAA